MPNQKSTAPYWDGQSFVDWGGLTADQWDAMLADANCLPANIYGPVYHTLFLGCSVVSFTASVGWNEQAGEVTVQLIEDTCSAASGKLYWDSNLQPRIWTAPDPGFPGPPSEAPTAHADRQDTLPRTAGNYVWLLRHCLNQHTPSLSRKALLYGTRNPQNPWPGPCKCLWL